MPTLEELLDKKNDRLTSVPDRFVSEMTEVQKELLKDIGLLLAEFDLDREGNLEVSKKNLDLAGELDIKLKQALDRSEYSEAVTAFAKEFNVQAGVNDVYFAQAFSGFTTSDLGKAFVKQAQQNAVELLINVSPDADFIIPIKRQVEQAVINNASFRETLDILQQITTGDAETEGKIMQYSKQIAHDSFAVSDRSYASAVAEELGAEWFKWSGSKIKTTRPFCAERHQKFFHYKEIEAWGNGERTQGFEWPKSGEWAGEMEGTNGKTIFSTAGGYSCRHSVMAVSIFIVPQKDVERAISLGYFTPSEFEKKELNL